MEQIAEAGGARALGISNVNAAQLVELVAFARIRPTYVQNRCYARTGWDVQVRDVCARHALVYQGFSLLTANRQVSASREVQAIAQRHGKTVPQVIFRFSQQLGMLPLTGTTDPAHMREDLDIEDFTLAPDELAAIETAG
jgi:diketogulonate reductase-like aldo/keto reductase